MKKKHRKFKPLQELYDRDDTLLKSKAVGLLKASLESTIDQALVVDPSQDKKVDSHGKLSSSEVSNIHSTSCQSSFSEDLQSLDSLKSPGYSKDLPMLQLAITSQTTAKHHDQDVFDCQGDNSSCISKDDGAAMISSDQYGGEDHKIVTSRAVSVSSPCPDVLEKSSNGPSISKGSPIASTQDPCLQNQNLMHEDRPDEPDELVDVRICDICGDAGREASLALCSKCSDGAEHIYCMSPKMDKVPEGDWFCEECLLMQDPKRQRQAMMEGPDNALNPSCLKEPSQGSPTVNSAIHHDGKMKTNHTSKASCSSDKRLGLAIDVRSKAKKGFVDRSAQPLKISSDSGGNSRLTHRSSLKNMNVKNNAARQVSSFVVPDKKMVKQGSSEHRSSKPEQQFCGGSFINKNIVDSSVSNLDVRHLREDIRQRNRSTKDKADCELKKDHPDKKVFKSLSLTGASSIPPDVSNVQSSILNIKGVRYGSNIAEKNYSLESKTNQVGFPFAGSSPAKVSSSSTKVAPQIGKAASSPIKSFEDKSAIQVNGNTNVEASDSLALEGKNLVNTSAGSVEERNSACHASYVINSPAKSVKAYPDLRTSLSTQKAELADIKRNDNDVSSFPVQHMKVKPTIDPVNLDRMAPNLTSAVPESRCIWRGAFSLEKSGKLPTDCYGVQAHLSTCASSKIADLVLKFSDELLLKEVPRLHTWPIQFQKNNPSEQDIAVYFFAQDLCSYERSYRMLLEGMSINDIALEANFGGFQLLVFPSSLLPARSQRWNSLPFLWGVFRMKNFDDSHVPDLNVGTVNQVVSSPATCGSQSKFISALLSGGSALRTSYSSMHRPESAKPVALPSSALVMSGEQSIVHELPPLKKHIATQKYHDFQADAITPVRDWSKEDSGGGRHSYDLKNDNTFSDNNIKSPMKTDIIPCGQLAREHTTAIGFRSDANYKDLSFTASELRQGHDVFSGNSFSLDSGPSGSSDGGECAKSAVELQIEPSENPRRYNTLNLNHCLDNRSGSEEVDLDLALGLPSQSGYEPEISLNDGIDRDGGVSLALSLGMPCSTSRPVLGNLRC